VRGGVSRLAQQLFGRPQRKLRDWKTADHCLVYMITISNIVSIEVIPV
jgi:hypothetical protein